MAQSDKRRRKQQQRQRRKAKERGPFVPSIEDKYISVDTGPLCFFNKITGTFTSDGGRSLTVKSIPVEDSIRPVTLTFEPPLQSAGTDPTCFDYQWQQLTYLFNFDDPAAFVCVIDKLTAEDRALLIRYVTTCRNLAGYTILNEKRGFNLSWKRRGSSAAVHADLPSHQEFSGFSATFRQLHNDGEAASFTKVWGIINRALTELGLDEHDLATARASLKSWKKARGKLSQKAAATLICEALDPNPTQPDGNRPRTLKGIVPEDLIRNFNYGDTLHWGNTREQLAELTNDPFNANFYKFCCTTTMTSLSHLYFGFAVLASAALGVAGTPRPAPS